MFTYKEVADTLKESFGIHNVPSPYQLKEESFLDISRVCDWRNYVDSVGWATRTDLERLCDYVYAYWSAEAEEWD